jgi:hypothetical protein
MSRLLARLGVIGVILLIGWAVTSVEESGPCADSKVESWITQSTAILDSHDYTISGSQSAYERQLQLDTPECLEKLQEQSLDIFYYSWKAEEAYQVGNYSLSTSYADKVEQAFIALETESDRLAAKYGWEN